MAGPTIRYDLLVQDALLGVVRKVLADAAREGPPGDHHFFVSFRTDAPGVQLSQRMKAKYPEEITIVLQHQFWDLEVRDDRFSVSLSFNQVPARLEVPFAAIKAFYDPSVQFGLQFQAEGETPTELGATPDDEDEDKTPDSEAVAPKPSGEVVELDLFRKK